MPKLILILVKALINLYKQHCFLYNNFGYFCFLNLRLMYCLQYSQLFCINIFKPFSYHLFIKAKVLLVLIFYSHSIQIIHSLTYHSLQFLKIILLFLQSIMMNQIISRVSNTSLPFRFFSTVKNIRNVESLLKKYSDQLALSKDMEAMIPRQFSQQKLNKLSSNQRFSNGKNDIISLTKTFSEPIWDLLDRGGKRWRPVLCMFIAEILGHKRSDVLDIAALCQIIHNGTLMVDDIEDSSSIRRNKPCVHLLFGTDIAINSGNMMYYAPMLTLMKSGKYSPEILLKLNEIYLQEMTQLHIGQGWDILWHNSQKLQRRYPTEQQYLQMTAHKTGVLARLSSRMVCACLKASEQQTSALINFVENMGVAFQIQDDILNLQGQQFKKTKGYNGQDIHEGKITLMAIHHIQTSQNPQEFINLLNKHTDNEVQITRAIELLKISGSIQYARSKMQSLVDQSFISLDKIFEDSQSRLILKQLAQFGIKRQK